MWHISYSPRGPGHLIAFEALFTKNPSPQEVAKAFGVSEGQHYERIIDGSFTTIELEKTCESTPANKTN